MARTKNKMAPDLSVVTVVLILMSFWNACHSFDQSQIDAFINKVQFCFRFCVKIQGILLEKTYYLV